MCCGGGVEPLAIPREARDHVQVEVKEMLVARRVVVLPQCYAVGSEHASSRASDARLHGEDRARERIRELVDVLDMLSGASSH